MSSRQAKRVYTEKAVERWLERLDVDWERSFAADVLRDARDLYRSGGIRELELNPDFAIVHSKQDRKEFYAVVEWETEKRKPHVRISTQDRRLGYSLAAAGLYEIEELLAEEASPLPFEEAKKPKGEEEVGGVGINGAPRRVNGNGVAHPEVAKPEEAEPATKEIALRLEGSRQGLLLKPRWVFKDGRPPQIAVLSSIGKLSDLKQAEREQVVRLITFLRRTPFVYRSAVKDYLLPEPDAIVSFLNEQLQQWRRHYKVELDETAKKLAKGVRSVELLAEGKRRGEGLSVGWRFRLDGDDLPESLRAALARNGRATVIDPDVGIVKLEQEQADWLENWKHFLGDGERQAVPRYMLFSLLGQKAVPVDIADELRAWREAVEAPREALPLPEFLRPYQAEGVRWMAHLCDNDCHGLLADEMGLGKTLQVASLIVSRPVEGLPSLIVCPASVVPVWQAEVARFFPAMGTEVLSKTNTFSEEGGDALWIASYSQLRRHRHLLDDHEFAYVALDEAQQIKNPDAKTTQACMAIRARHRIALTGTPVENSPLDLWTLFRFLMPGLLGGRSHFKERLERNPEVFLERLRRQTQPFVMRRTKNEVAKELPEKVESDLVCPLTDLQEREYKRLAGEAREQYGAEGEARNMVSFFALLTRLRQAACDPGLLPTPGRKPGVHQSGKLVALLDHLADPVSQGRKVVVFSQFTTFLTRAKEALKKRYPRLPQYQLTGRTRNREKPVSEFQNAKGAAVFLVSLKAGGTGITLHAADYVFLLDPWWNPAVEAQAIDRVHRIGQDKTVFVYRMVTQGTIEERVARLKDQKRDLFDSLVGSMETSGKSRDHLQELLDLVDGGGRDAE